MNRITIFERNGLVFCQLEHLSKQPSGNGAQRRKQIKSGWKPEWVKAGQSVPFTAFRNDTVTILPTGDPEIVSIEVQNNTVAGIYINHADSTVDQIALQTATFKLDSPDPNACGYCRESIYGGPRCTACGGL